MKTFYAEKQVKPHVIALNGNNTRNVNNNGMTNYNGMSEVNVGLASVNVSLSLFR